jgi:hypothetical protein
MVGRYRFPRCGSLTLLILGALLTGCSAGSMGSPSSSSAGSRPGQAEQTAAAFVDAYGRYDRTLLKSLVGGDALVHWASLDRSNRQDEAMQFRVLLDHCTALDTTSTGTRVTCTFDMHGLGSEQLGLGPFTDNQFDLTVRDAKIVESGMNFAYGTNGFAGEVWEPFFDWVTQHYPKDVARMIDGNGDPLPDATSIELFDQHIADYVAVKTP